MSNTNKFKVVSQVYETTDYALFSYIEGNRHVDQQTRNVKNLLRSFQQDDYLFTIIFVNEKYQIIDGQNRFEAAKKLLLPVRFVIIEGYGIDEVMIYNQNQKNWKMDEFVKSFANQKNEDYMFLYNLMIRYNIALKSIIPFFRGYAMYYNTNNNEASSLNKGLLEIINKNAIERKINLYAQLPLSGFTVKKDVFNSALSYLFDVKGYNNERMIERLLNSGLVLTKRVSILQYAELFETIYNYNMKKDRLPIVFAIKSMNPNLK